MKMQKYMCWQRQLTRKNSRVVLRAKVLFASNLSPHHVAPKLSQNCFHMNLQDFQNLSQSCPNLVFSLSHSCPYDFYKLSQKFFVYKLSQSYPKVVLKLSQRQNFTLLMSDVRTYCLISHIGEEIQALTVNFFFCVIETPLEIYNNKKSAKPQVLLGV